MEDSVCNLRNKSSFSLCKLGTEETGNRPHVFHVWLFHNLTASRTFKLYVVGSLDHLPPVVPQLFSIRYDLVLVFSSHGIPSRTVMIGRIWIPGLVCNKHGLELLEADPILDMVARNVSRSVPKHCQQQE